MKKKILNEVNKSECRAEGNNLGMNDNSLLLVCEITDETLPLYQNYR